MTLFDPGPPVVNPDDTEGLSVGARRTLRDRQTLDRGYHPATGVRLLAVGGQPPGQQATCADCIHHVVSRGHARRYHKCDQHQAGITGGPGTDIRVGWPACVLFDPRDG